VLEHVWTAGPSERRKSVGGPPVAGMAAWNVDTAVSGSPARAILSATPPPKQ
jgi:hypothetical protein